MALVRVARAGSFVGRVMAALKGAGFTRSELKVVRRWVEGAATRDAVLASGAGAAIGIAGLDAKEIFWLQAALSRAGERAARGEEPFTQSEKEEVERMLRRALTASAARRLAADIANSDEMVLAFLSNSIQRMTLGVTHGKLAITPKRMRDAD